MKYVPPHNGDTEDPDRPYVDADPGNGIEGSYPAAKGIEHPQREIVNAITAAGLVPDGNDLTQLAQVLSVLRSALVPTGTVSFFAGDTPPAGWLKRNGALVSRESYPDLWAHAQNDSGMIVTEATWLGGAFGNFSSGDGATTFRIPDGRAEFIRGFDDGRGIDAGRNLASFQEDALQNITGAFNIDVWAVSGSGAFEVNGGADHANSTSSGGYNGGVVFDASNVVRTAGETRPRNIAYLPIIKY